MARLISTGKSPCMSYQGINGWECPHFHNDRDSGPCANCKLPMQYDDRISSGPKRFTDHMPKANKETAKGIAEDFAYVTGYGSICEAIEALHSDGLTYEAISQEIGVSRRTLQEYRKAEVSTSKSLKFRRRSKND